MRLDPITNCHALDLVFCVIHPYVSVRVYMCASHNSMLYVAVLHGPFATWSSLKSLEKEHEEKTKMKNIQVNRAEKSHLRTAATAVATAVKLFHQGIIAFKGVFLT